MLIGVLFTVQYYNIRSAQMMSLNILEMLENEINIYKIKTIDDFRKFVTQSDKEDLRITIISTNGTVIADTLISNLDKNPIENHGDRSEFIETLHGPSNHVAYSLKESETQDIVSIYSAKKIKVDNNDYILRTAIPIDSINRYFLSFLFTILIVLTIVIIIIALVLPLITRNIMVPFNIIKSSLNNISENNSEIPKNLTNFDEINVVLYDINRLASNLNNNIKKYQTEKEKLGYVLENIEQGIIAIDKDKNIVFINQYTLDLLDISKDTPTHILEIMREKEVIEKINKAVELNRYSRFDISSHNGSVNIAFTIIPIFNNSKIVALIKLEDVTDIRKLEIEKQDFFINASHELNTPLTSIVGYSELLLSNNSKNREDFAKRINDEALRMKDLVSDMLTLSKIEESWQETIDEKIDLKEIVINVLASNKLKASNKNITIIKDIESGFIFANKEKIIEVVNNLVDNAIKYTDKDGEIKVKLNSSKDKIVFSVIDTGCGIPSQYLNRIFERFFRVKNEQYLKVSGTGLGLTIVKNICNYYKADIYIKSKEHVGTEISVDFTAYKK